MNNRIVNRQRGQLSRIGMLKIGTKVKNAKGVEFPKSHDYFRPSGQFAELFTKQFGDKPNKVLVFFPNNDCISQQYELYDGKKRVAVSDGQTVRYVKDGEFQESVFLSFDEATDFMKEYAESMPRKCEWAVTLKVQFIIAQLDNVMALWEFQTKGKASMVNQIANAYDNAIEMFGSVVGVPFWLSVGNVEHVSPIDGKKHIWPVVSLDVAMSPAQLMQLKNNSLSDGKMDVAMLIDNSISMLLPNSRPALPPINTHSAQQLPQIKQLPEDSKINAFKAIETDSKTLEEVKESINKSGYDSSFLSTPRDEYLQEIAKSLKDESEIDMGLTVLESKGFEVTESTANQLKSFIAK